MEELPELQNLIFEIRGHKVMLDSDLAWIYHVETKALNRAVKRNIGRFPPEFMFRLTAEEAVRRLSMKVCCLVLPVLHKCSIPDLIALQSFAFRVIFPPPFTFISLFSRYFSA